MGPFSTLCSSLFHHLPPLQLLVTVYHSTNIRHTNSAGTSRGITASAVTFWIGACYGEVRTGAPHGSSNLPRAPHPRTTCPAAGGTSASGDRKGGGDEVSHPDPLLLAAQGSGIPKEELRCIIMQAHARRDPVCRTCLWLNALNMRVCFPKKMRLQDYFCTLTPTNF